MDITMREIVLCSSMLKVGLCIAGLALFFVSELFGLVRRSLAAKAGAKASGSSSDKKND